MVSTSPLTKSLSLLSVLFIAVLLLNVAPNALGQGSQTQVGARVQLEGQIQIQYQDFKDHSRLSYTLKLPNGKTVPLQFMKNPPSHFLTGDHVRVDGQQQSDGNVVLYTGSNVTTSSGGSTSTSSIPVPNTIGPQSTLVILVNFQDSATQPYSVSDAQNMYFGSVNSFISENSYGQTSLSGDVVGWFTIPDSITTCNMSQLATDAKNAASAAGVNLSNYTRYVYAFPYNTVCGFAGSSYVGGNPSESWINLNTLDVHVISHELGHAFGLWHSHSLDCGTNATICSNGNVVEYGDSLDVMGVPQTASPHYNAFQKERLGWLNYGISPSIQTVQASGTYTINAYELGGSGPNALKILKSTDSTTGAKTWYYLEQRQPNGFDAFLSSPSYYTQNETTGVLFHIGTDGNGNTGDLLDMTPSTPISSGWQDPSLVTSNSFQDSAVNVTITPTAVSSTGATVQVTMNGSSCTPRNPSVSVSPSQSQKVSPGTAVDFTATVVNNDSSSCSTSMFNLGDFVPSGWAGAWTSTTLSLSPGKSGSATLTVQSPTITADGSYNVTVSATNASVSSENGSANGIYVVATPGPLSISVSTSQSSYQPGQTVAISVTALSGTSPVAGASVTATVTPPSGKLATIKGTTGSNGVAWLSYKLSRRAAAGTYQVGASATGGTSTSKSISLANTSFTVQ